MSLACKVLEIFGITETSPEWLGYKFDKAWDKRSKDPEKSVHNVSSGGKPSRTHDQIHSIMDLWSAKRDRLVKKGKGSETEIQAAFDKGAERSRQERD